MGYGPPDRPPSDKVRVRRQLSAQTWFARTTRVRWGSWRQRPVVVVAAGQGGHVHRLYRGRMTSGSARNRLRRCWPAWFARLGTMV
jgi:hypothetical protein